MLWCDEDEDDESDDGGDEDTDNIIIFNCRCRDYQLANAATTANAVTPAQVCLPQEVCECRGGGGWVPAVQEQDKLRHLLLPPHGGLGRPALGQPGQAHQRGPKRPIQKEIFVSKYQTPQFKVPIRTMALSSQK